MTRSVRVLTRAQSDLETCYAFIAKRSPQGAASWFNRFAEIRDRLAIAAEMRPLAPESAHFDYDIREVFFKTRKGNPYRVLFTVLDDEVLVLRVRGPGQDYVSDAGLPERPGRE